VLGYWREDSRSRHQVGRP